MCWWSRKAGRSISGTHFYAKGLLCFACFYKRRGRERQLNISTRGSRACFPDKFAEVNLHLCSHNFLHRDICLVAFSRWLTVIIIIKNASHSVPSCYWQPWLSSATAAPTKLLITLSKCTANIPTTTARQVRDHANDIITHNKTGWFAPCPFCRFKKNNKKNPKNKQKHHWERKEKDNWRKINVCISSRFHFFVGKRIY